MSSFWEKVMRVRDLRHTGSTTTSTGLNRPVTSYHQTFMGTSARGMILTTPAVDWSARVSSVG